MEEEISDCKLIFLSKSQLLLTTLRQKKANNAKKMHEDILGGDTLILNKTRGKYREELLNSILLKTWRLIPSNFDQLHPLITSNPLQLHDKFVKDLAMV